MKREGNKCPFFSREAALRAVALFAEVRKSMPTRILNRTGSARLAAASLSVGSKVTTAVGKYFEGQFFTSVAFPGIYGERKQEPDCKLRYGFT